MSESIITEKGHEYPVLDTGENILKLGRCSKCGVEREVGGSKFDCRGIAKVRGRLRRGFTQDDQNGFRYRAIFGCDPEMMSFSQHVLVRVELRQSNELAFAFTFQVFVDFHLPNGAGVDDAEHFLKATRDAVRKARWARKVVEGLAWSMGDIRSNE